MSDKVENYWQQYLSTLPENHTHQEVSYLAWGFGDNPHMADELGRLVVEGTKTATAGLLWDYEHKQEALLQVGQINIILDGRDEPMCIVETTSVYIVPYNEVDAEQAYVEGEGDRTLEYWREAHWRFFTRRCEAIGRVPDETMPVVCERFKVIYRG